MIDSGLEVRHADLLRTSELKSRVIALWDQKSHATDGVAGQNGLGRVYSKAVIEQALADKKKLGTNDEGVGHGTLVAGVAVGDGSPRTCCVGKSTYIGIAPDAEIIAVGLNLSGPLGNSNNAIRALNFIFTHPDGVGRPLVVNISLGVMRGAHDGSIRPRSKRRSMRDRGARTFGRCRCGRQLRPEEMARQGNRAAARRISLAPVQIRGRRHEGSLPRSLVSCRACPQREGHRPRQQCPTAARRFASGWHSPAARSSILVQRTARRRADLRFVADAPSHDNNDNVIALSFTNGARPKNDWTFQLINPSPAPIEFHAWLERETSNDDNKTATFRRSDERRHDKRAGDRGGGDRRRCLRNKTNRATAFPPATSRASRATVLFARTRWGT